MSIPEGSLYTDKIRNAGEIAEHYPAEYIVGRISEGSNKFGYAVVQGTDSEKVKVPVADVKKLAGVAGFSFAASDLDNNTYLENDPVEMIKAGVVVVPVMEAVDPSCEVRVMLTGEHAGAFLKTAETGKTAVVANAEFAGETDTEGFVPVILKGDLDLTPDVAEGE